MRVILRLRTASETVIVPGRPANRRLAGGTAPVLGLAAIAGFAVCAWRWGNDLQMLESFPFVEGVFSRWQVWFGLALLLQTLSSLLGSYGRQAARQPVRPGGSPHTLKSLPSPQSNA